MGKPKKVTDAAEKVLNGKRLQAMTETLIAAGLTGAASAAPTPTLEVPKQIGLAVGDFVLCYKIWYTYFEKGLTERKLADILKEAGVVAVLAGGAGYVGLKATQGLLDELANWLGPFGWLASGGVTAATTMAVGGAWTLFVDQEYCRRMGLTRLALT